MARVVWGLESRVGSRVGFQQGLLLDRRPKGCPNGGLVSPNWSCLLANRKGDQGRRKDSGLRRKKNAGHKGASIVSAILPKQSDEKETPQLPSLQQISQLWSRALASNEKYKPILLLNVLAFIDGATAVVIKVTELNNGSEAAGTSLMFLVRLMLGLLAFAPALSHQRDKEAALRALSISRTAKAGIIVPKKLGTIMLRPHSATNLESKATALSLPDTPSTEAAAKRAALDTRASPLASTASSSSLSSAEGKLIEGSWRLPGVTSSKQSVSQNEDGVWKTLYLPGIISGVFMFLGDAGQALGLETTSADHAAVLLAGSVILVPFLEVFGGRKIGAPVWLSALMATAGMVLLEQGSAMTSLLSGLPSELLEVSGMPVGDCWCIMSSMAFALYIVLSEEQCSKTDPMKLAATQLATTVVLSALWEAWDLHHSGGAAQGALLLRHLAAMPWTAVLFVGVIGTGLATWMELHALQSVNSTTATLVYTTGPLWSAVLAYFALGETMDAVSCGGAALILLASVGTQLFAAPKTQHGESVPPDLSGFNLTNLGLPVDDSLASHGASELPASRSTLKLLLARAVASRPRLLNRIEVVPQLRKFFYKLRR